MGKHFLHSHNFLIKFFSLPSFGLLKKVKKEYQKIYCFRSTQIKVLKKKEKERKEKGEKDVKERCHFERGKLFVNVLIYSFFFLIYSMLDVKFILE